MSSEKTKSTAYWKVFEDDVEHIGVGKSKEESIEASILWLSFKQRFFNATFLNENIETYYFTTKKIKVVSEKVELFLTVFPEAKKRFFYDEKWKLTSENNSKYYREYSKLDTISRTHKLMAYYTSNNQLQWEGNVRNNNPKATNCLTAKCEGNTIWYKEDGSLSSATNYLEGRQHEKSILYLKSGKIFVMNYHRGKYIKEE
mgnify:CR=1 FL=1